MNPCIFVCNYCDKPLKPDYMYISNKKYHKICGQIKLRESEKQKTYKRWFCFKC